MAWVTKRKAADGSARYVARYRDPAGEKRSAGTFRNRPDAERAGTAAEIRIGEGTWVDRKAGRVRFVDYVEGAWWPNLHLELTTMSGYRSNLDAHFLPFFGRYPMSKITPTLVQGWVQTALAGGLSHRSIRKYHTLLHGIFRDAVRDRVISHNPCEATSLPKVVTTRREIIAPEQFEQGRDDGTRYTALYRDGTGQQRSAGTFPSRREAERAGWQAESSLADGSWIDRTSGRITFDDYLEKVWWPSRHSEVSTRAGHRSYLDKHFLPLQQMLDERASRFHTAISPNRPAADTTALRVRRFGSTAASTASS